MIFTIEMLGSTGDVDRFLLSGYLSHEEGEEALMSEMILALEDLLTTKIKDFDNHIIIRDGKIIYNKIPLTPCYNIMQIFERNFDIKITTRLGSRVRYIPKHSRPLALMELRRLFKVVE